MKQIHPWLRAIFYLGSVLSLLAGVQLFFLSDKTDLYFSWTIQSTLMAATLGAFYFGAMMFGILAWREKAWANVRGPAFGLFAFIVLTLVATLLHLDRFHLGNENLVTRTSTWVWMSVYFVLPVVMLIALVLQARALGADPRRTSTLPAWIRLLSFLHALAGILLAGWLFFAPQSLIPAWPWSLTPLTARALAAWLFALGIVSLQAILENDWRRNRLMAYGFGVSATLAIIAVMRYASQMNWQSTLGIGYLTYLVLMLAIGVMSLLPLRRA
jgi:hypothetical protein